MSNIEADRRIRERALELGFDVVGVARADEPLGIEHERYRAFIDAGMHGSMQYLADHVEARRRLDTPHILEGARSVVCVGKVYARTAEAEKSDPELARMMARYARGQDYHGFVRKKVRKLAAFIRRLGPDVEARPLCDVEPIMERAFAMRAGIGFVGKNGLVIAPGKGSFMLLGEVVTTLELVPDVPMNERCGSCTRCLDACPTQAFVKPFVLDPRRCISYFTIEHPDAPPEELRSAIGDHFFGCDVCQEVCPYNRTAPPAAERTEGFRPLERWKDVSLGDFASMDEATFAEKTQGTPLSRAGRGGLARNAVIVATNLIERDPKNSRADDFRRVVEVASDHEDPAAREVARVALEKLGHVRSALDPDEVVAVSHEGESVVARGGPEGGERAILSENSAAISASTYESDPPVALRVKRAPA